MKHPVVASFAQRAAITLGRAFDLLDVAVLLGCLPLLALGMQAAFGLGGLVALAGMGLAAGLLAHLRQTARGPWRPACGSARNRLVGALDRALANPGPDGGETGALVIWPDGLGRLSERLDPNDLDRVRGLLHDRLAGCLRQHDHAAVLADGSFAVALQATPGLDIEAMLQVAGRMQAAVAEPIEISAGRLRVTCAIGACLSRSLETPTGTALLSSAEAALEDARSAGLGAVRVFSRELEARLLRRHRLASELAGALESGDILPWFQPQVSTDTGAVTGAEALARWIHPDLGPISPADFLPLLEDSGRLPRLGAVMLEAALRRLKDWDAAGVRVPHVALNMSRQELEEDGLAERIAWQLDRFELSADRLTVEILESVVASEPEGQIARNLAKLATLGCGIDLDDFGTGHASISTLRALPIRRVKIDRSFVQAVDTDREQQRMVATILSMCERLDLDAVAEGVESRGEHAMLAQLGCRHVQGFVVARPMPAADLAAWITEHGRDLAKLPELRRRSG